LIKSEKVKCKNNKKNLELLCLLYGLCILYKDSSSCFESGYFSPGTSSLVVQAIKEINKMLRPQIINIVESQPLPDILLQSAIGNSFGDIYETHLEWAKNSRLNKTKAGDAIPDGYIEHILPITQGKL